MIPYLSTDRRSGFGDIDDAGQSVVFQMAEPVPRLRVVVLSPVETEREFRQRIGENFAMAPIVHVVGYCRDITQLDTQVAEQLQRPGPLIVVINTHGRDDGSFK